MSGSGGSSSSRGRQVKRPAHMDEEFGEGDASDGEPSGSRHRGGKRGPAALSGERKRREHMNELLDKLRQLVPTLATSSQTPSKSAILQAVLSHIQEVTGLIQQMESEIARQETLSQELMALLPQLQREVEMEAASSAGGPAIGVSGGGPKSSDDCSSNGEIFFGSSSASSASSMVPPGLSTSSAPERLQGIEAPSLSPVAAMRPADRRPRRSVAVPFGAAADMSNDSSPLLDATPPLSSVDAEVAGASAADDSVAVAAVTTGAPAPAVTDASATPPSVSSAGVADVSSSNGGAQTTWDVPGVARI